MDFALNEEQLAVQAAASAVMEGMVTVPGIFDVETSEDRVDRELWAALAAADLLSLAVPTDLGGGGLGLTELCLLLEVQGRHVAPVPLWATLVLGALPLAHFGSAEQQARFLPTVARGETFLTAALSGVAVSEARRPAVLAQPGERGWRLTGSILAVPGAHLASRILVPALAPDGTTVLALLDPRADGVTLERAVTTNREIHPHLHLTGAEVPFDEILVHGAAGAPALEWVIQAATVGLCALQVGIGESAVHQTAEYLNQRVQFGRPLSTFQGTMLRAADAAIDLEAVRVTLWQAAWRLDTGRPAAEAVAVAKWQASERGQRVVHATQHLHGGMGADITYPIHRYFLWGKQIELLLGGPSVQLAHLGRLIAARALANASGPTQ